MSAIKDSTIRESILETEGNIIISADAGTGKTFMTVERIKRDVIKMDNYQTYAAITFTNKAAREILDRLGKRQQGFVGTNDRFVLNEVIIPFSKDVYPQLKGKNIKTDYSEAYKCASGKELLVNFLSKGIIGTYSDAHSNFAFKLALHILKQSHASRRYLANRYFRVYVDEYQDSDIDMHKFFMYLNQTIKIPFFIVGDIKQSIYEWRGGYPDGFRNLLLSNNYTNFKLLHNFRSNQQIQNYASIFIDDIKVNYQKCNLNGEVQGCFYDSDEKLINYIDEWIKEGQNCAFLVYSNREAKEWAQKLEILDFVYIPRAPIEDPVLDNGQVWIARCLANYFYKKRYSEYSFYDEIPNQDAYNIAIIKSILKSIKKEYEKNRWTKSIEQQIRKLYQYILVNYDMDGLIKEIQKLKETIEDSQYEKSFNIEAYERVVTTIHSSKGLQYDQVMINSENFIYDNQINNEELHYVAITRPENKLLILFNKRKEKSRSYYKIVKTRIESIMIDEQPQKLNNVIQFIKT